MLLEGDAWSPRAMRRAALLSQGALVGGMLVVISSRETDCAVDGMPAWSTIAILELAGVSSGVLAYGT
jgi:hypothetical protein